MNPLPEFLLAYVIRKVSGKIAVQVIQCIYPGQQPALALRFRIICFQQGLISLHDSCRQVTIRDGNKLISNKLIHIRHIRRQTVCLICFSSRLPPVLLHDLYGTTCQQVVQIITKIPFTSLSHSHHRSQFLHRDK